MSGPLEKPCGLILSILLLIVAGGCLGDRPSDSAGASGSARNSTPESSTADPFAGQQLEIDVPAGLGFPAAWEFILDEWSEQTAAAYRLRKYDWRGDRPWTEMLGGTLMVLPISAVAELSAAGHLAAIPQEQRSKKNLHWLDVLPGLRENVATLGKKPTVIPLSCPVLVCYYRRDLLEKANLSPPKTWDDYQTLIDSRDRWAPGMTAVEPWGEEYRATMFLARAVSYAKHPGYFSLFFDYETCEPWIDSDGFVRALEDAQRAWSGMPPDVARFSPADCRRELLAGRAALAIAFETGPGNPRLPFGPAGRARTARQGTTGGRSNADSISDRPESMLIGCQRLPGSPEVYNRSTGTWETPPGGGVNQVTLAGFAGLCAAVSANATPLEAQAAWNLLARLSLDHLQTAFPGATKSPCRALHLATAAPWTGRELSVDERFSYLGAVADSLRDHRLVVELPIVRRSEFRRALTEEIGNVLIRKTEPPEALSTTAEKWRAIIERIGVERVRESYRRALGLASPANKAE